MSGPRLAWQPASGLRARRYGAFWLLLPAMLPVVALSVYPLVRGIYLGFTDARAGLDVDYQFNGLANYADLLHDHLFLSSIRTGLAWTLSVTVLQVTLGLGLALLLNQRLHGRWLARPLAIVPWAMPPVVVGIMWHLVYRPDAGLLNELLYRLHLSDSGVNLLGDIDTVFPAVVVVGVWAGLPVNAIILLAGLQSVPRELHEAAAVDAAGVWARFRCITLPHLRGVLVAITTLDLVWNFTSFDLVYVLTGGGPGGRTTLPSLLAYQEAFRYGHYGYAAALGNVMVCGVLAVLVVFLRRRLREQA